MNTAYRFAYPAVLSRDEDGSVIVEFPDIPEARTNGRDETDALEQATDALIVALSTYIDEGRALPLPSRPHRTQAVVALPALAAVKLAIYQAMRDAGLSQTALAAHMKCDRKLVQRLLDLDHQSTVGQLEAALAALGKELVIEVRDAA